MTQESQFVLEYFFRNKLYDNHEDPFADASPEVREFVEKWKIKNDSYCAAVFEFPTHEDALSFNASIRELHEIEIAYKIQIGECEFATDGMLMGAFYVIDRWVVVEMLRDHARILDSQTYFAYGYQNQLKTYENFIDFAERGNGRHLDELLHGELLGCEM